MDQVIDLSGQRFGRLTVVSYAGTDKHRKAKWNCKCDCGNETTSPSSCLRLGKTNSCGCIKEEEMKTRFLKHGHTKDYEKSGEYRSWRDMKRRCTKPNATGYENYGGRGIGYTDRWTNFETFLEDMGNKPTPNHSLERINVNGNYEPSNCMWATDGEQARNKRIQYNNKSGTRGVNWHKATMKWQVRISFDKERIELGHYDALEDAITARKQAELKYWKKSS